MQCVFVPKQWLMLCLPSLQGIVGSVQRRVRPPGAAPTAGEDDMLDLVQTSFLCFNSAVSVSTLFGQQRLLQCSTTFILHTAAVHPSDHRHSAHSACQRLKDQVSSVKPRICMPPYQETDARARERALDEAARRKLLAAWQVRLSGKPASVLLFLEGRGSLCACAGTCRRSLDRVTLRCKCSPFSAGARFSSSSYRLHGSCLGSVSYYVPQSFPRL